MEKSPQAFEIAQNGDGDCARASQGRAFRQKKGWVAKSTEKDA
jgi:hypothetical protein